VKKNIWVFSGRQGSGKSTYAKWLQAFLGLNRSTTMKFAEPLYALHDKCLPVLHEYALRPQSMKKDGELLQVLGSEYGRDKLGKNVWVDCLKQRAQKYLAEHPTNHIIIDDCRFENEFDAFADEAHMIRLTAPEYVRKARCSYWREDTTHVSEIGLDEYEQKCMFHALVDTQDGNPKDTLEKLLTHWGYINP
jgi:hypothetical protein